MFPLSLTRVVVISHASYILPFGSCRQGEKVTTVPQAERLKAQGNEKLKVEVPRESSETCWGHRVNTLPETNVPRHSMYGIIFTYMCQIFMVNVGKIPYIECLGYTPTKFNSKRP